MKQGVDIVRKGVIYMNETLIQVLAWVAGGMLGAIFFGGLWGTVRKGVMFQRPELLLFGSLVLRVSLGLVAFYSVGRGHWERLGLCFLGFVTARLILTRRRRAAGENQILPSQEASHAP